MWRNPFAWGDEKCFHFWFKNFTFTDQKSNGIVKIAEQQMRRQNWIQWSQMNEEGNAFIENRNVNQLTDHYIDPSLFSSHFHWTSTSSVSGKMSWISLSIKFFIHSPFCVCIYQVIAVKVCMNEVRIENMVEFFSSFWR